jgi:Spy/CpxP family protein refolding chaperone
MNPRRKQIVLIGLTVLALSAGVVVGMVASRLPAARDAADADPTVDASDQSAGLAEQLNLTPSQAEQMRSIWEAVRNELRTSFESAEALQKQRDADVFAMLSDEQKARFESISKRYGERFTALREERDAAFRRAVERTRKLLNDEQRAKYDELLKARVTADPGRPAL